MIYLRILITNKVLILFIFYFISIYHPIKAEESKKNIVFNSIKFNNYEGLWTNLKILSAVEYEKMNDMGIPIGLVINRELDYLELKFGMSDNSPAQFYYRLLGHDSCWKKCDSFKWAKFKYLKNGKYQLEVKAKDHEKIISNMTLKFTIDANIEDMLIDVFSIILSIFLILILIKMK